jgi:site-specific DNA-methyltransferase (adenine-specific)
MRAYTNENCMTVLSRLKDREIDLAIVDPPYGINANKNGQVGHYGGKGKDWDSEKPSPRYFQELLRVSKNQIIWGGNYFTDMLPQKNCWLVWDKLMTGGVPFSDCELAYTSFKESIKKISISIQTNYLLEKRVHPTQKPVALYKWLLSNYAKKGDIILDTHAGSCSSLIACEELGFDYIACELDPDYYAESNKRLENYRSQIKLFS